MPKQNSLPRSARLNILVLSPHRGDAAFALALSIAAWLQQGHAVTLLNAFTRSLDAPFSDADSVHPNDRLSYVSAMRKKEDEAFLRQIPGASMADVNIKDAPLRLHCSPAAVYELPLDPNDGALVKIRKALTRHLTLPNPALVIPLAPGNSHIDHRVAREAALPLAAGLPFAFYRDAPTTDEANSTDPSLMPIVYAPTNPLSWKRKAILLYTSQIEDHTASEIVNFDDGQERLWANQPFLAHTTPTIPHP